MNLTMSSIKRMLTAEAIMLVGGLAANVIPNGTAIALPTIAAAMAGGYKTLQDYIKQGRENPMYFLWKVKSKNLIPLPTCRFALPNKAICLNPLLDPHQWISLQ